MCLCLRHLSADRHAPSSGGFPAPPLVGGEAVREYRKDEHTDGEGSILFIFYISGNMPGGLRVRVCTELDKQTGFWEQSTEKGGVDFGGHFLPVCRHEL